MKIALIGNCQVSGLAACLRALNSSLEADPFLAASCRSPDEAADLAHRLKSYDVVLTHKLDPGRYGPLAASALMTSVRRLIPVPPIAFGGFHPDVVIIPDAKLGVLGAYHSIIAAGAWLARIPAHRVAPLYNAYIFARLGYMEEYGLARAFMAERLARAKLEPEHLLRRWEASGKFMHTPNHPTIAALGDLARVLGERLGVQTEGQLPDDELASNLRLPLYPEIARRLGLEGCSDVYSKSTEALSIRQCVELSFAAYDAGAPDLAGVPRIAAAAALLRQELDRTALD